MTVKENRYPKAPVVEAILDIDCDLPPGFDLEKIKDSAKELFSKSYPVGKKAFVQTHQIEARTEPDPVYSFAQELNALQFLKENGEQLVQVRSIGFSFNRLAPYSSLSEYFPEIEQAWKQFCEFASPIETRRIALRYINRILIPNRESGKIQLDDYISVGHKIPCENRITLTSFLNQFSGIDSKTNHQVSMVITNQDAGPEGLPVILDICVSDSFRINPDNWEQIRAQIHSLRDLKNLVFEETITDQCRTLFQV